jgi:hypothetical protein
MMKMAVSISLDTQSDIYLQDNLLSVSIDQSNYYAKQRIPFPWI